MQRDCTCGGVFGEEHGRVGQIGQVHDCRLDNDVTSTLLEDSRVDKDERCEPASRLENKYQTTARILITLQTQVYFDRQNLSFD